MNHEPGGNRDDEANKMMPESATNPKTELRKRRSTRIVQAVPLMVTGVDALGRPFTERTSSLIINCHGCRYQSKHYVLKNMWVTLEIPHPEAGAAPRTVRGRVAWIQRPRTVRQLFQVALELETPGNVWGIAFPPEDWFAFPGGSQVSIIAGLTQDIMHEMTHQTMHDATQETTHHPSPQVESESHMPLNEREVPAPVGSDNVFVFPSPNSPTDASLLLARQLSRLLAEAKQQINAATREAVSTAIGAELRTAYEQWEQKFTAARAEVVNESSRAVEKIQHEVDAHGKASRAGAVESLQNEVLGWLTPKLEQSVEELTAKLSAQTVAQRAEHESQTTSAAASLRELCTRAEETAARLRLHTEDAEAEITERAETTARELQDAVREQERVARTHQENWQSAANDFRDRLALELAAAQAAWQKQLTCELDDAQVRWHEALEATIATAQERAARGVHEQAQSLQSQLQEETAKHAAAVSESAKEASATTEKRLETLRAAVEERSQALESVLARANEATERLENYSARIENVQQQALGGFQSQLDDILSLHRNELHRRSESLYEEISARIRGGIEESSRQAAALLGEQIETLVQPHVSRAEDAVQRLAGGRALLDAALMMQQDRIRGAADEAFAEAMAGFRENLGTVEQLLQESSGAITTRNLVELEEKISDLKHQTVEDLLKSAEWYEKKAQTQIQNLTEKAGEQAANHLREKAGEVSSLFASELDHSSRNFVGHAQRQMDEVVRDSFERARGLFAEAAETTSAAFTDEIQRTARQELEGFSQELTRSAGETRAQLDAAQNELAHKLSSEQEGFLRRFHAAMNEALQTGIADAQEKVQSGMTPLLDSWKSRTDDLHKEMQGVYEKFNEQAAEQYRAKMENVSNQWMLATVSSLDHQSRTLVSGVTAAAEEKLRDACERVFAGIGDSLRERLKEIVSGFPPLSDSPIKSKSAKSGT